MCGILAVFSQAPLAADRHQAALKLLQRRGPDFTVQKQIGSVVVAQTVLHITGSADFYHRPIIDGFAYNGEIYNYGEFGSYSNDVELAYATARERPEKFRYFEGPWAWAYTSSGTQLFYASDPQGERCLYHYQDQDLTIVCSEVAPILTYIAAKPQSLPYCNKSWTMIEHTPWQGIKRCRPGVLYCNGEPVSVIDSIWQWIKPNQPTTPADFGSMIELWQKIIRPNESATLSYSGGLDSNIVMNNLPGMELLAVNTQGKDSIVDCIPQFLSVTELARFRQIVVDPEQWANHYREMIALTQMPAQSWSHVGRWLVSKHAANRIVFTGMAADELLGGYPCYRHIEYSQQGSTSPYSSDDHDGVWDQCLNAYNGDARQATLLMDYWYQVVGVDAPGADRLGGAWGRETRNPFMLKSVMQWALNLPWEAKVGHSGKMPVRTEFLRRWPEHLIFAKQGFAGHANDSLPWLGVNIDATGDRHRDWQAIAQKTFYSYVIPQSIS